jgi:glutamate-ammonia-ligase adenylyltransferase
MSFASRIARWPTPFDPALGDEAAARFAGLGPEVAALIRGTAGCSPYLKGLIQRHGDWLEAALEAGPEAALAAEMAALEAEDLGPRLRVAKGRVALLIALADLGGLWPVMQVTQALTEFADRAVSLALETSVRHEITRGKLPETGRAAGGLVALAMGKMGAGELNYSSDIDLIVLFEGEPFGDALQEARPALVRATRNMAKLLSEITSGGYVFRTDLRLRPDAAVTPVALSMAAAEHYYESVGRTWERAAHIKARAAAGDIAAGEAYLRRLRPFVWRRHLDFAAIQDAHDMRLRIREHKGLFGPITLPGHNMKLGRGGIREIEFFTQTRQLIAGGRDPDLRVRGTLAGLSALQAKGWIEADVAARLSAAYEAHREVEHRLQMIADAQTHDLPGDGAGFDRLAAFMGQEAGALKDALRQRLEEVHALTEDFFAPNGGAVAKGSAAPDLTDATREMLRGWYSYPALRSARAVEIFERLKPDLLDRLARAAKPDEALAQFDLFLSGLPAGVQLFSLFEANPQLVDLIIDISGTAPALARYLGRNAQVLDAVIGGSFFAPWPGCATLAAELAAVLAGEGDYERQLDAARRWHKEWHFRVGVHFLRGLVSAEEAGAAYADLAEATIRALWPAAEREFSRKFGTPPGQGAAVLGMGSLGARQLSATSDLDLIVIYDADGLAMSEGGKPLPARQYYARLTKAFVTALSAQTAEGALYEVDMRLRPSGRQGPVATSLSGFRAYQLGEAWTWEHLALTRARFVGGAASVGAAVEAVRAEVLALPRQRDAVLADVAAMRARLAEAAPADLGWEAKRGAGRMQDIELLAQTAVLLSGGGPRGARAQIEAAHWLGPAARGRLQGTHSWLWSLQAAMRLLTGRMIALSDLGEGGRAFVLAQTGAADEAALARELDARTADAAESVERALAVEPENDPGRD